MSHVYLKQPNGQLLAFEADDTTGVIQQSLNGDPSTFDDMPSGDAVNAAHADLADLATAASTAAGPTDATVFTATLDLATASLKGLESAADKALADYENARWEITTREALRALIPELTDYEYVKVGQNPISSAPTATADGAIEGGGAKSVTSNFSSPTRSIWQLPKTKRWAVAWRAVIAAPVAAHSADLGICNAGGTHAVTIATNEATDATHYVLFIYGAGTTPVVSTVVADGLIHDFYITFDLTTIRAYVDGVLAASTATLTNLIDEPMWPAFISNNAGEVTAVKLLYGYISP